MNLELVNLLKEENIISRRKVGNWQEAVEIASEPLLKNKDIEEAYVEKMKESVIRNGPYMVLGNYFALMHARPEDGVNRLSMSLLILEEATDMKGEDVRIFLVLAAVDNKQHIDALASITNILMEEDKFNLLLNGSKGDILNLIK